MMVFEVAETNLLAQKTLKCDQILTIIIMEDLIEGTSSMYKMFTSSFTFVYVVYQLQKIFELKSNLET